jgi:tetratricopeptide (TPR) repeat protein
MKTLSIALSAAILVLATPSPARADDAGDLKAAAAAFQAADYKAVLEAVEKVPADSESAPKARYLAGEARLVLGDAEKAADDFRAVLERKPKALPAQVGLGRALTALGKTDEAQKALDAAVALDPKDASAKRAVGELRIKTGDLDGALKALDEAAKAAPNDPQTARAQVEARLRKDQGKEAQAIAERLAKALPKHPMGPFLRALALEKEGKDDEAIKAYEAAIALDDKFLDAHKNLAILCHTRNPTYQDRVRTEKAMKHYERYFELGGADPALRETYDQMVSFFKSQK